MNDMNLPKIGGQSMKEIYTLASLTYFNCKVVEEDKVLKRINEELKGTFSKDD